MTGFARGAAGYRARSLASVASTRELRRRATDDAHAVALWSASDEGWKATMYVALHFGNPVEDVAVAAGLRPNEVLAVTGWEP